MDGGLFEAVKLNDPDGTEYGYVGDIVKTNPQIVLDMLEKGYIPVVTCVAAGIDDTCNYNINADTAAEKLAIALKAKKLIMLTDVRGLLRDPSDDTTLIKRLKVSDVPSLVKEGVIKGRHDPEGQLLRGVRPSGRRACEHPGRPCAALDLNRAAHKRRRWNHVFIGGTRNDCRRDQEKRFRIYHAYLRTV